jgi:hypothetical protein
LAVVVFFAAVVFLAVVVVFFAAVVFLAVVVVFFAAGFFAEEVDLRVVVFLVVTLRPNS